ncbi:MAG TPA: inorganic diphosphatase [Candidatus Tyrphobacter sp.]|nr:inorganic diphosphatase [Candidatus Tyrphobacter sp.]
MKIDVLIEIPRGSRNKYELDEETGRIKLDRVLRSSVEYPADYGLIPQTKGEDGDPLDALVIARFPFVPGALVPARPVALLKMIDNGESDSKIIAVPAVDIYFDSWAEESDLPEALKKEIAQFFSTYKILENKTVELKGWGSRAEAEKLIESSSTLK